MLNLNTDTIFEKAIATVLALGVVGIIGSTIQLHITSYSLHKFNLEAIKYMENTRIAINTISKETQELNVTSSVQKERIMYVEEDVKILQQGVKANRKDIVEIQKNEVGVDTEIKAMQIKINEWD